MLDFKKEKLLIIHMDDIGMNYAANKAAINLFKRGIVTSASVMIPCGWTKDFINWAKDNTEYDIGVHSTFTCEWETGRWRGLCSVREISGLYDRDGFLARSSKEVTDNISADKFRKELNLQIEQALKWGLKPSHLDNHMFVISSKPEFFDEYLGASREYKLKPHIPNWIFFNEEMKEVYEKYSFKTIDNYVSSGENGKGYRFKKESLYEELSKLCPGLNMLTIHPVTETEEIRAIMPKEEVEARIMEYELFMDEDTRKALIKNNIKLISWKDV